MNLSVLLVEDDLDLQLEIASYLKSTGFSVRCAGSIEEAEKTFNAPADLYIIDINLPDGDGLELCRYLRYTQRVGIIICTARSERDLRIFSLKDGADAYLVKPIDPEELEATLISVYRRLHEPRSGFFFTSKTPPWRLDISQSILIAPNAVGVLLLSSERKILNLLFQRKSRTATREELIELFNDVPDKASSQRLEAIISRLRRKINDKTGLKFPISPIYGQGYEFSERAQIVNELL